MIFTGNTADGKAYISKGAYLFPCGNRWSTKPYTRDQSAYDKVYEHCSRYRKSFADLHYQLTSGSKENLPKWVRVWFLEKMKESNLEEVKVKLFEV